MERWKGLPRQILVTRPLAPPMSSIRIQFPIVLVTFVTTTQLHNANVYKLIGVLLLKNKSMFDTAHNATIRFSRVLGARMWGSLAWLGLLGAWTLRKKFCGGFGSGNTKKLIMVCVYNWDTERTQQCRRIQPTT